MTTDELRQLYLEFFKSKGHEIIPSASLIPENDATVLFTMAGMHPLVPFLMGENHPLGRRLANAQKCIRTGDIDEVGDNRHLTFFEMLGNWSLGDYFKENAIEWSFEFLTSPQWLNLDPKRFYVTVFGGDETAPRDNLSIQVWQKCFNQAGIMAEVSDSGNWENENTRIFALGKNDNWWGLTTGPCGPCSEMFYDTRIDEGYLSQSFDDLVNSGRFFEVWNDVFMEYNKKEDGELVALSQKNVDTGMGLERTVAVLNGLAEVFEIDEFGQLFDEIETLAQVKYEYNKSAFRIIADHVRSATMILGDQKGIVPTNLDQGYVLRRLIRRAVRYGKQIGIEGLFLGKIAKVVIRQLHLIYPELKVNEQFIFDELRKEEEKFAATLEKGLREIKKKFKFESNDNGLKGFTINANDLFYLYSTFGFPIELSFEEIDNYRLEHGYPKVDEGVKKHFTSLFNQNMLKHQALSRKGAEQKFKGGLADTGEDTRRLHTATHLLQAALRQVLGAHVFQKGSNITPERLRFDFSHPEKMTPEQIVQVESLVNDWISKNYEVKCEEIPYMDAKERGAIGLFEDKYGEVVKLYSVGDISCELCGGPHANHTGELGKFKIVKEEASSAGVRRIKAILE